MESQQRYLSTMFRLNLWSRPFFPHPQPLPDGGQNDSSDLPPPPPFLPGPMQNPLMLLAAHERQQREYRMDKDQPVFNHPFPVFRQNELPMFTPMMPFLQPGLRHMNPNFRPLMDEPKRSPENLSLTSPKKGEEEGREVKEGTVTPNSVYDVNSEVMSESGESEGRWTPDENGRPIKRARKQVFRDGHCQQCPICGLTVKPTDLEAHVRQEIERLHNMQRRIPRRTPSRDGQSPSPTVHRPQLSPSTSIANGHHGSGEASANVMAAAQARIDTYQRVRSNRQARLSAKTRCRKQRDQRDQRPRHVEETNCPVCTRRLSGTPEELNEHVEQCLKKSRSPQDEDGLVDVDGDSSFEEYTWCGQTRVRAASMLQGGYKGAGFTVATKSCEDDDVNLDVDGDDTAVYGAAQYSESDIIPCRNDVSDEERDNQRLRGEYIKTAVNQVQSQPSERNRWISENDCSEPSSSGMDLTMGSQQHEHEAENGLSSTDDLASSREEVIESLRKKISEQSVLLEKRDHRFKCLICMDQFTIPLVSIQCWHVHCEECWLRTLGAKKLCPQCNMITSPSDLRKVYL